jgi:dTDP-4-amino-4,6-dideoxygalactose transaminase
MYYPVPVHRQPSVTGGKRAKELPVTDAIVERILSPPMHPKLTEAQVKRVCREFGAYFTGG